MQYYIFKKITYQTLLEITECFNFQMTQIWKLLPKSRNFFKVADIWSPTSTAKIFFNGKIFQVLEFRWDPSAIKFQCNIHGDHESMENCPPD